VRTKSVRLSLPIVFGLATALVLAGLAWACVPTADISVDPRSGPPGSRVTVSGSSFGDRRVEIRWDSQVLAQAQGPSFTATVTIPASSAGVKILEAVAYNQDGAVAGSTGAPFEVTPPAGQTQSPGLPTSPQAPPARQAPGSGPPARPPTARNGESRRAERDRASQGAGRSESSAGGSATPGVLARGNERFFAGSLSADAQAPAAPTNSSRNSRSSATRGASERSAAGDLWSGFGRGSTPGLGAVGTEADPPGGQMTTILLLLALGLTLLSAGLAVAVTSRRRSPVRGSS
jgi:hypothetical protein